MGYIPSVDGMLKSAEIRSRIERAERERRFCESLVCAIAPVVLEAALAAGEPEPVPRFVWGIVESIIAEGKRRQAAEQRDA